MDVQLNLKELPLLSVVVRAYNIEKELLDRCISSVVRQTYINLEIILINNASTDDTTGIYCDEWQQKDYRIQVIHTQERIGFLKIMKITTGEYIHLLDHDDWIAPDMYANMMSAILSTNSDIARCEFCLAYPDGRIVQRKIKHHTDSYEIIGREEGVLLLLEDKKWQAYFWQNIFKKHLFDNYSPSIKNTYGDLSRTHTIFHHALQTVYLHDVYYFYYQRPNSMVNPQTIQKKKMVAYCWSNSLYERYLFVKQYPQYHSMLQPLKKKVTVTSIYSLWDMIDDPQAFPDSAYEEQVERLKQFSLSLGDGVYSIFNFDLLILKLFPRSYPLFYKLFYRNLKHLYHCIKVCYKRLIRSSL